MHHYASRDAPPTFFIKPHAKDKHGGPSKALLCRNLMEACEAREHGSDSKKNHQVEGSIMQAKEWTRTFGRCNPKKHAVTEEQSKHECTGENRSWEEQQTTQAGRPKPAVLPPFNVLWCSPSSGKLLIQSLVVCLSS
jgi:hypothetical protein